MARKQTILTEAGAIALAEMVNLGECELILCNPAEADALLAAKDKCSNAEARAEQLTEALRDGVMCVVSLLSGDTGAKDDAYQWIDRPITRAAFASDTSEPKGEPVTSTINHHNPDVTQVAATLADACHAGGLSDAYYRKADDALARLAFAADGKTP